jgi:hypothetical protein
MNPTPRQLRPRPAIALRASFVSQENCLQVLGVDARRFLERVVPTCKASVVSLGKLRLVPIDDAEAALRRLATPAGQHSDDGDDNPVDLQPQTPEEVLAKLGLERS